MKRAAVAKQAAENSGLGLEITKGIPQGLRAGVNFHALRHESTRALTLLAASGEFFRSL